MWAAALCALGGIVGVTSLVPPPGTYPELLMPPCPTECICLSQSQVVCNSAKLRGVPSALGAVVTQLSLSRADLRVLHTDAFAHMRQLRRVTLDACNLTRIRPFAFRGLPKLKEILIQHTVLATVDSFSFAALQNVTSIILTHNKIVQIDCYAFAGSNFMRLLSFRNNPIKKIAAHAFSGLGDVAQIELPSGIKSIEPMAFSGLEGVGVLELAYMDLPALVQDSFRGLLRVGRLSLRDSDLGTIQFGVFDGLQRVDLLEICNNKIDSVEDLTLVANNSVRSFQFTGNHLLETPESVVLEVDEILIKGNHLPCDCRRNPLTSPLSLTEDFEEENLCISPLKFRGRSLSQVWNGLCRGEAAGSARARAVAAAGRTRASHSLSLALLMFMAHLGLL